MTDKTCKTCGWWAECDSQCEGYCDSGSSLWGGHLTAPAMTCGRWEPPTETEEEVRDEFYPDQEGYDYDE